RELDPSQQSRQRPLRRQADDQARDSRGGENGNTDVADYLELEQQQCPGDEVDGNGDHPPQNYKLGPSRSGPRQVRWTSGGQFFEAIRRPRERPQQKAGCGEESQCTAKDGARTVSLGAKE